MKIVCALAAIVLMTGCTNREIAQISRQFSEKDNGIIVAGTYNPFTHNLLHLTSGINIKINTDNEQSVPWAEERFINLPPGRNKFEIWYNWGTEAGLEKGCFTLEKGQIVYLEYHPPMWGAFSRADVRLSDLRTKSEIATDRGCFPSQ